MPAPPSSRAPAADPSRRDESFAPLPHDRALAPDQLDGPVRRWWEHTRGWPSGVPVTTALRRRIAYERSRTSVGEDMRTRLTDSGITMKQSGAFILVAATFPQTYQIALMFFGSSPVLIGGWLLVILVVEYLLVRRIFRVITAPWIRASLRREGVDCCVKCGHLMGRGGTADACSECGFDHAHLPLRWGPS